MKKINPIQKGLLSILMIAIVGIIMCFCSKVDHPTDLIEKSIHETRAGETNHDWECTYCFTKNFEWKTVCVVCGTKYSEYHANFVTTLWNILTDTGFVTEIAGLNESNIGNRIQLPNKKFPSIRPIGLHPTMPRA